MVALFVSTRRSWSKLRRSKSTVRVVDDDSDDTPRITSPTINAEVQRLLLETERLQQRCAALEAQNILVAVQQLDMLERFLASMVSLLLWVGYARAVLWSMDAGMSAIGTSVLDYTSLSGSIRIQESIQTIMISLWNMFKAILVAWPVLYNHHTYGSLKRRYEVFVIAGIMLSRIRLCRWRERMYQQTSTEPEFGQGMSSQAIWDAKYEVGARFTYAAILRLGGLWIKMAQFVAARADFMPAPYVRELKRLQDHTPATDWTEIQSMLCSELLEQLTDIEETPIASASIGQVHVAKLKATGEKVVVKVQHPHARYLLTEDFWALEIVMKVVAWFEPDYAFVEILMREWACEARKELDFGQEARNLVDANIALEKLLQAGVLFTNASEASPLPVPFRVEVPRPILSLTSRDVLVMAFCDGVRIDNFAQLQKWGLSRNAVFDGVAQAHSYLLFCANIFNGDPHPGNIAIRPGTTRTRGGFTLVLFDWGLAKRLPTEKRIAFCQMVQAAATFDYGLIQDSYKTMGLQLKFEASSENLGATRFLLRDMAPSEVARKRMEASMQNNADRMQTVKKEERMNFVSKSYPRELFLFIRVNELLHGLGSQFEVHLPYIDVIQPYAERGLRESSYYRVERSLFQSAPRSSIDSPLHNRLDQELRTMHQEGLVTGAQLCVLDKQGTQLVDGAVGSLGGLKTHETLRRNDLIVGHFCTKAITATLAHLMVELGYLTYDEPVCLRIWTSFCPFDDAPTTLFKVLKMHPNAIRQRWAWKRQITLRHILKHQAGMSLIVPTNLTIRSMMSCEESFRAYQYNADHPETTLLPESQPGESCQYHALSFGWLVAGTLCGAYALRHRLNEVTYDKVYTSLLLPKLSEQTVAAGFRPTGGSGDHVLALTVSTDIVKKVRRLQMDSSGNKSANEGADISNSYKGKEILLDPRVWNSQDAIDSNVPSVGGRFSAAGLAHFYHNLGNGRLLSENVWNEVSSSADLQATKIPGGQGTVCLGFGYQFFRFGPLERKSASAIGHAGGGGCIGLYHKPSGHSMALMLNNADRGHEVPLRILRTLIEQLRL